MSRARKSSQPTLLPGVHAWSVYEWSYDWLRGTKKPKLISTHKTKIAADVRAGGRGNQLVGRTSVVLALKSGRVKL